MRERKTETRGPQVGRALCKVPPSTNLPGLSCRTGYLRQSRQGNTPISTLTPREQSPAKRAGWSPISLPWGFSGFSTTCRGLTTKRKRRETKSRREPTKKIITENLSSFRKILMPSARAGHGAPYPHCAWWFPVPGMRLLLGTSIVSLKLIWVSLRFLCGFSVTPLRFLPLPAASLRLL